MDKGIDGWIDYIKMLMQKIGGMYLSVHSISFASAGCLKFSKIKMGGGVGNCGLRFKTLMKVSASSQDSSEIQGSFWKGMCGLCDINDFFNVFILAQLYPKEQ